MPLPSKSELVFLGVPFSHTQNPLVLLAHGLRKTHNAYFGLRSILKARHTPLSMKFQLFHSYITSKWMWAAGVVWPSVRALKAVEGYQNTMIVGILGLARDPLVEWVQDFRAVRRAAKYLCGQHGGPQWRRDWLCRVWRYWGHVARSTVSTPLSSMVAEGGGIGISMGRVAAAHVVATIPRKLQFCFAQFSSRHRSPAWHIVAQDRLAWATLEVAWLGHWGVRLHLFGTQPGGACHATASCGGGGDGAAQATSCFPG